MSSVIFCAFSKRLVTLNFLNYIHKIELRKCRHLNIGDSNSPVTSQLRKIGTGLPAQQSSKPNKARSDEVGDSINQAIAGSKTVKVDHKQWVEYNPFKTAVSADWVSFLSQEIDWDTFIEDRLADRKMNKLRAMQEYSIERKKFLGADLAAARFVVAMNGKVKLYGDDHWYSRETVSEKSLPEEKTSGLTVEAADLSKTQLLYEGIENLFQAESMLYLSLSDCIRLDEWSVSRLALIPSIVSLDLSYNPYITERCLIPLQYIPNLQKLDLTGIKYFTDQPLPLVFLEELLPNCVITTG